jgi:glucosamine kinase
MSYYLGVDGGGTKTDCVLLDASGRLLGRGTAGPSNPLRCGFSAAFEALDVAVEQTLAAAQLDVGRVTAVCVGLAGAGRSRVVKRIMAHLVERFPTADVHVTTDLEVALEAAVGSGPGVVLIAGTGSAALGRSPAGRLARAGGWGPWIGDEGSAFEIGRRAVQAVARARDRLAPVTLLSDSIPAALACSNWDTLVEHIAENPLELYPRIYPLVVEAAEQEDATAREILFSAALHLSRLAASVIRRLQMAEQEFLVARAGGVFGRSRLLDSAVDALLAGVAPRARIELLRTAPAVGAARLAQRLLSAETKAHGRAR